MVAPEEVCSDCILSTSDEMLASNPKQNVGVASKPLPKGRYIMVGIDIDTTGRRLIDEIVQLAAYTPDNHFEQYIMPYMNLNPAARQRHQVRVISIGFYRMLKSMTTYKVIKSKSEIEALKDFLNWLEAIKAKDANADGIVLIYHEERKFVPYMILEALKKYYLLDRFMHSVKGFADGMSMARTNLKDPLQNYGLRKLHKLIPTQKDDFLSRDYFDGDAAKRARLTYEVALSICNLGKPQQLSSVESYENFQSVIVNYAYAVEEDVNGLKAQNDNLERQNSFRPVFLNYFKAALYHRVRAVKYRIILAENGLTLGQLQTIWLEKKNEGIANVLKNIAAFKEEDKQELVELFDSFFDPEKTTFKPISRNNMNGGGGGGANNSVPNNNRNRRSRRMPSNAAEGNRLYKSNMTQNRQQQQQDVAEQGAGGDKENRGIHRAAQQSDFIHSMKPQRQRRQRQMRRNLKNDAEGVLLHAATNKLPPIAAAVPAQ